MEKEKKHKNKKEFRMGGNLKAYDQYIPRYNHKHSWWNVYNYNIVWVPNEFFLPI